MRASSSEVRRGKRYYRLSTFNRHRVSYRIAYRHDPGDATTNFISVCLRDGTLTLDMSGRFGGRKKPSECDHELQTLIASANL